MDAAKEIVLYYLEALADASEEIARFGRMDAKTHERLARAHTYLSSLKDSRVVGGFGVTIHENAASFPTAFPRAAPRLLNVLGAARILLSHPEAARLAFHDQAWRLVDESRHFMQAIDLGWVKVQAPLAVAPQTR